ncbi:hypothetical protein F4780DRAFT_404682 [Xylariomycetidae sp. FL0641]|nr:hypothetical protein F4780DRAFT_404682 [Xylariomycetidae sp. FL0641]
MATPDPMPQTPSAKLNFDDVHHHHHQQDPPYLSATRPDDGGGTLVGMNDKAHAEAVGFLNPNDLRRFSYSPFSQDGRRSPISLRAFSPAPAAAGILNHHNYHHHHRTRPGLRGWVDAQWHRNKAPLLIAAAQMFGALMNLSARWLEVSSSSAPPMHPIQILFVRMVLTVAASSLYILRRGGAGAGAGAGAIPHGLLGPPAVRPLLAARAVAGFFGIFGMWYSLTALPLAEATVVTFLSPALAAALCHRLLGDPFTRTERLGGLLALAGVVLVTRPASLFRGNTLAEGAEVEAGADPPAPRRLAALAMALLGVAGGALATTALRCIGPRAHPLVSVNYFSAWCVLVTAGVLAVYPRLRPASLASPSSSSAGEEEGEVEDALATGFAGTLPRSPLHAALVLAICLCGLAMQVLTTRGLAAERSNRALAMVYTHVLFAAALDRLVFGAVMGWAGVAGCALVVGSAVWVALSKQGPDAEGAIAAKLEDVEGAPGGLPEAVPMMAAVPEEEEDEEDGDEEEGRRERRRGGEFDDVFVERL